MFQESSFVPFSFAQWNRSLCHDKQIDMVGTLQLQPSQCFGHAAMQAGSSSSAKHSV